MSKANKLGFRTAGELDSTSVSDYFLLNFARKYNSSFSQKKCDKRVKDHKVVELENRKRQMLIFKLIISPFCPPHPTLFVATFQLLRSLYVFLILSESVYDQNNGYPRCTVAQTRPHKRLTN